MEDQWPMPFGPMVLKIYRRSDQQVSTLQPGKSEYFKISNESLITSGVNDGIIYLSVWAEGNTDADPIKYVITTAEACQDYEWNYQINRNVALIHYRSIAGNNHCELWNLSHPMVHLILPNCNSFLTENEKQMEAHSSKFSVNPTRWLLDTNSNSEYLVRVYSDDCDAIFVLIFHGFTSSTYRHRITMPENVLDYCINMRIFGTGKNSKTVLTMQNTSHFFVYDMSNGQMVLTIRNGPFH